MSLQGIFESFLGKSLEALEEYHVQCHSLLLEMPGLVLTMEYPTFVVKATESPEKQTPDEVDKILVRLCQGKSDPLSVASLKSAKAKLPGLSIAEIEMRIQKLLSDADTVNKP